MKTLLLLVVIAAVSAINYECSNANLNIRSGAGTTYSINWVANLGDNFQVLAINGVWHQVKAASGSQCGNTGWAHSDYLVSCSGTGDCNTPPPPSSGGPSSGAWVSPNVGLNIRTGASTSNSVQWVAQVGDVFQVISSSNGWSNVRAASGSTYCGLTGWASSQYLVASQSSSCSSTPPPPPPPVNPPSGSYPLYKQCSSAWGSQALGYSGGETICSAGCAMSSVSMALSKFGAAYNPGTLNSWLISNGGYASGNLIVWDAVRPLGLTAATSVSFDATGLANTLAAGKPVIANVNSGGHWVLVTGNAGSGNFYVNDPGYTRSTYAFSEMMPGRFVVYTAVARVQSVRGGDASSDASDDELAVQLFTDVDTVGKRTVRIVSHSADGTAQTTVYPEGNQVHQPATALLPTELRRRRRRRRGGMSDLLKPVNGSKPKNGPRTP